MSLLIWLAVAVVLAVSLNQYFNVKNDPVAAIVRIIDSGTGCGLDFCGGMLSVYELEDGRFVVNSNYPVAWEEVFTEPEDAARFFLDKRMEMQIGYDIEAQLERHRADAQAPMRQVLS